MARATKTESTTDDLDRLIARRELRRRFPVSDMTIWRWMRAKRFPEPIRVGGRNYWRESEIRDWFRSQSAADRGDSSNA